MSFPMGYIEQCEKERLEREAKALKRQALKCELFGVHDWKITRSVRLCKCCKKRQFRPIDEEGRYMDQGVKGLWVIRCRYRRMDDEPTTDHQFMTESFFRMLFRTYRLIKVWGAYEVNVHWSPLR